MIKFTDKIGLLMLCIIYLVATLGFSIHTCMCERTSNVVLIWEHEQQTFEHSDSECHTESGCCHSDSHSECDGNECCSTELFVVDDSFLINDNDNLIASVKTLLSSHIALDEVSPILSIFNYRQDHLYDIPGNKPPLECDIFVKNAQYRL